MSEPSLSVKFCISNWSEPGRVAVPLQVGAAPMPPGLHSPQFPPSFPALDPLTSTSEATAPLVIVIGTTPPESRELRVPTAQVPLGNPRALVVDAVGAVPPWQLPNVSDPCDTEIDNVEGTTLMVNEVLPLPA